MQKKKYDLTSDIVDVSLEGKEQALMQSLEALSKDQNKNNNNNNVLLTISLDAKKRNEFKAWCAKKGLKINEAF